MEQIKKNWKYVVGVVLVLLVLHTCETNRQKASEGERKQLEKQLKKAQDGVKVLEDRRLKLKDSVIKVINKSKQRIVELEKENTSLYSSIVKEKEKTKKRKESLKNYTYKDYADTFNNIYKTTTVGYNNTSVILNDSVPRQITDDLIERDELKSVVDIQEDIISNKDKTITEKDIIIASKDLELKTSNDLINAQKEENLILEDLKKNGEKTIKSLKVKGTVKTILIPLAFFGGFLLTK